MADAGHRGRTAGPRRAPPAPRWLLVHGFLGAAAGWAAVTRALAAAVPGAAIDAWALPGHGGGSARVPRDFWGLVDRLAAAIRRRGRAPIVVGYSLGGRLALGLRARHPALCAAVATVGAHPGLTGAADRADRAAGDAAWARRLATEPLAQVLAAWEAQPLFAAQAQAAPQAAARQRAWRRQLDGPRLARVLSAASLARMPDLWPSLARPGPPLLFVAGAADAKFARLARAAHRAAAAATASRCVLLPGCGHSPLVEAPAALAAALAQWHLRCPAVFGQEGPTAATGGRRGRSASA